MTHCCTEPTGGSEFCFAFAGTGDLHKSTWCSCYEDQISLFLYSPVWTLHADLPSKIKHRVKHFVFGFKCRDCWGAKSSSMFLRFSTQDASTPPVFSVIKSLEEKKMKYSILEMKLLFCDLSSLTRYGSLQWPIHLHNVAVAESVGKAANTEGRWAKVEIFYFRRVLPEILILRGAEGGRDCVWRFWA